MVDGFFLSAFECVIPLSLAPIVSHEQSAIYLTGIPLPVMSHAPLAAFRILVFFAFQRFHLDTSGCGSLCVYCTWTLLSYLDAQVYVFHYTWAVFSHYLKKKKSVIFSLSSTSNIPIICMSVCSVVPHISPSLLIFPCSLHCLIFIVLKFVDSSSFNLVFSPCSEIFLLVIVLF